jgi:hypothetical protein
MVRPYLNPGVLLQERVRVASGIEGVQAASAGAAWLSNRQLDVSAFFLRFHCLARALPAVADTALA